MTFPSRPSVHDPLLAFIYLNGGPNYEVPAETTYVVLADYFQLSSHDRALTRDQYFNDGRPEPAWNNLVQRVRQTLVGDGLFEDNSPRGMWKLSSNGIAYIRDKAGSYPTLSPRTEIAVDIDDPSPTSRAKTEVYRILRDTALARRLKLLYGNACQICGLAVPLAHGQLYSEAHHLKPLGMPHNGPDIEENIIIVCPIHHVQCDYGAIQIDATTLIASS